MPTNGSDTRFFLHPEPGKTNIMLAVWLHRKQRRRCFGSRQQAAGSITLGCAVMDDGEYMHHAGAMCAGHAALKWTAKIVERRRNKSTANADCLLRIGF